MASRNLGALTVDLVLKMGGFKQGADQATRETARIRSRIEADMNRLRTSFSRVNGLLAGFGVGFSAVAITQGLASAAREAIEYGDNIQKASDKTGIAASTFSELAYAAKQNDVELDALSTGFKKLQTTISQAGSGNKTALATFKALGIEFDALRALKPEDQFERIADQISKLQDPADRTRAAVELFGRAGADLLPLFTDGARGIRALREEAEKVGATLTDEQAKALAETDDAIKRLSQSYDGLARMLTAKVAPALTAYFNALTDTNQPVEELQRRIEVLQQLVAVKSFFGLDTSDAKAQLDELRKRIGLVAADARLKAISRGGGSEVLARADAPPGFQPGGDPARVKELTRAQLAGLEELTVRVRDITASATEQLYRQMDAATQTSMQKQLAEWEAFDAQVRELVNRGEAGGGISAAEGARRIAENNASILEELEVTAQRIEPLAGAATAYAYQIEYLTDQLKDGAITQKEFNAAVIEADEAYKNSGKALSTLSVYAEEAKRNTQDILSGFLDGLGQGRLDNIVDDFAAMFRKIAAQALAARLADKLFDGVDGWISKLSGLFGGKGAASGILGSIGDFFGGLFAEGGYTGPGGKYEPAGIVHRGEGVLSQEDIRRLGGPQGFFDLIGAIRGYADGGLVGMPAMAPSFPSRAMAVQTQGGKGGDTYNLSVPISAPTGTVSRSTELQISAAIARGIRMADSRGN
jgi:hypothetical protein